MNCRGSVFAPLPSDGGLCNELDIQQAEDAADAAFRELGQLTSGSPWSAIFYLNLVAFSEAHTPERVMRHNLRRKLQLRNDRVEGLEGAVRNMCFIRAKLHGESELPEAYMFEDLSESEGEPSLEQSHVQGVVDWGSCPQEDAASEAEGVQLESRAQEPTQVSLTNEPVDREANTEDEAVASEADEADGDAKALRFMDLVESCSWLDRESEAELRPASARSRRRVPPLLWRTAIAPGMLESGPGPPIRNAWDVKDPVLRPVEPEIPRHGPSSPLARQLGVILRPGPDSPFFPKCKAQNIPSFDHCDLEADDRPEDRRLPRIRGIPSPEVSLSPRGSKTLPRAIAERRVRTVTAMRVPHNAKQFHTG